MSPGGCSWKSPFPQDFRQIETQIKALTALRDTHPSSKSALTMRDFDTLAEDISVDVDDASSHSHSGVQRVQRVGSPPPSLGSLGSLGSLEASRWLVHVGGDDVFGPVSARQVAEAMKSGRLPAEASIQAVGEVFWTGLLDEPAIVAALQAI